jgi:hypothetical protein
MLSTCWLAPDDGSISDEARMGPRSPTADADSRIARPAADVATFEIGKHEWEASGLLTGRPTRRLNCGELDEHDPRQTPIAYANAQFAIAPSEPRFSAKTASEPASALSPIQS